MAVDVDNATLPVDNSLTSPASEGAGEFRALKAKVNQLFLNSGVAATYPGLIDTANKGVNVAISDGSNITLQSSRFKVTRTASQPKDTLGMYSESVLANGVTTPANILSAFYSITDAGTGATFGGMYCLNSLVRQQNNNQTGQALGIYVVFTNRSAPGVAAASGLGANKYNVGAIALGIDSYARSSSGEYCGWKTGIKFLATSMDRDFNGGGYCIDMSGLTKVVTADPRTTYQCKGGIRLGNMLSVVYDDAEDVMMYYDPATTRMTIRYQNVLVWAVDILTGSVYKNNVLQY
jgi:hypothetical protein